MKDIPYAASKNYTIEVKSDKLNNIIIDNRQCVNET